MTTLFAIPAEGISESTSSGIAIPLPPQPGVMKFGSVADPSESDYKRNNFFRPTGTYYDKALTDIVYCYDVLWEPDYAVGAPKNGPGGTGPSARASPSRATVDSHSVDF